MNIQITVDIREQTLYDLLLQKTATPPPSPVTIIKQTLLLGDILIGFPKSSPMVIIERKTFSDLFASIIDGRYEEQSYRLKNASGLHCHNIIYLFEGIVSKLSPEKTDLLYSCMTSAVFFKGFSVFRTATVNETTDFILAMQKKLVREIQKGSVFYYSVGQITDALAEPPTESYMSVGVTKKKAENITPQNIGVAILCQIPSVNYITAEAIMAGYQGGFKEFYTAFLESQGGILDGIKITKEGKTARKISSKCIENIKVFLS